MDRKRDEFQRTVTAAVSSVEEPVYLQGSFAHGDFHLRSTTPASFSDVDCVLSEATATTCEQVRRTVETELASRLDHTLKVSVHPGAHFSLLSGPDARFLALGEYLRHVVAIGSDPIQAAFHRAKIFLLVLRESQRERYGDVAARLSHIPEVCRAHAVKLGFEDEFPAEVPIRILRSSQTPPEGHRLAQWLTVDDLASERDLYRAELRSKTSISRWLRHYVADKV